MKFKKLINTTFIVALIVMLVTGYLFYRSRENQIEHASVQALDQILRQGLIQLKNDLGVAFVQRAHQRRQPRHRDDLGNAHAQRAGNGLRRRDAFTELGGEVEKLFHVGDELAPLGGDPRRPL